TSPWSTSGSFTLDNDSPTVDTGTLTVGTGADTLQLGDLTGDTFLSDSDITVSVDIAKADTAELYFRNDGSLPTTGDTKIAMSNTSGTTFEATIPKSDVADPQTINFAIYSGDTIPNHTMSDSMGQGYQFEVNSPPTLEWVYPDTNALVHDNVSGTYTITDPGNDPGTVTIEVSVDSGATWDTVATIIGGETASVTTSSEGTKHPFTWDSYEDLPDTEIHSVKLRIHAFDGWESGPWRDPTFTVDNIDPTADTDVQVDDGFTTLKVAGLDGTNSLKDGKAHHAKVGVKNADTVLLHHTNDGTLADLNDTEVHLSNTSDSIWEGDIPDTHFNAGDTINFIVFAKDNAGNTDVNDSGGQGYEYGVESSNIESFPVSTSFEGVANDWNYTLVSKSASFDTSGTAHTGANALLADGNGGFPDGDTLELDPVDLTSVDTVVFVFWFQGGASLESSEFARFWVEDQNGNSITPGDHFRDQFWNYAEGDAMEGAGYERLGIMVPASADTAQPFIELGSDGSGGDESLLVDDVTMDTVPTIETVESTSFSGDGWPIELKYSGTGTFDTSTATASESKDGDGNALLGTSLSAKAKANFGDVDLSASDTGYIQFWGDFNGTFEGGEYIQAYVEFNNGSFQIPLGDTSVGQPFYYGEGMSSSSSHWLDGANFPSGYGRFSIPIPASADTVSFTLEMDNSASSEEFFIDVVKVFGKKTSGAGDNPSVTINAPNNNHDTNVTPVQFSGSTNTVPDAGDSVFITAGGSNGTTVDSAPVVNTGSDSTWTASSVDLNDLSDSYTANLLQEGPGSDTVATDTITVTLDQDSPDSSVTGVAMNDTGHYAVEVKWDTFENTPDTVSGFGEWVVYYARGSSVTTSDTVWTSDTDADLTDMTADSTIITDLADNQKYTFGVTYRDGATNEHSPLSTVTVVTREQTLVINELNINPSTEDSGEWFEVFNTTSDTILVDGYQLTTGAGNVWTIPTNNWQLSPGKSMVLANDAGEFRTVYEGPPNFAASGTSGNGSDTDLASSLMSGLNNTDDTAALFDSSGKLLDSLRWGSPAGAKNNHSISTVAGNGVPTNLRKTEGDEGRIQADRPELGEFTERLDQTFGDSSAGTFDSEGPDTDGIIISRADILITDPPNNTDTTASFISVSGTSADADAGDSVTILSDGTEVDSAVVQSDADGSWTADSVSITSGDNTIKARLHSSDAASNLRATDEITVRKIDQFATLRLTEISPIGDGSSDASPNDWAEMVVTDTGSTGRKWQVVSDEGESVALDVIDTTLAIGDTIVIHIESGTSDTTTKSGGSGPDAANDQWDIYGSGIDWQDILTADGSAMIREGGKGATIQDAVFWSNGDETVGSVVDDDLDTANAAGEWAFIDDVDSTEPREFDLVPPWHNSPSSKRVIYRNAANDDADSKASWDVITTPSLGDPNVDNSFNKDVGSGTATPEQTILKGGSNETIEFLYTAKSNFSDTNHPHGRLTIVIPSIWPRPSLTDGSKQGFIDVHYPISGGNRSDGADSFLYERSSGDTVFVIEYRDGLANGETTSITYGSRTRGGPGLTVPNSNGVDTFWIQSDPTGNNVDRIVQSEQPTIERTTPDTVVLKPDNDPGGSPGDTTQVTATVRDADGDSIQGVFVDFFVGTDPPGGGSPTWFDTQPTDGETDKNGQVTVVFKTDANAAGVNELSATVSGVDGGDTFTQTTSLAGSGTATITPTRARKNQEDSFTMTYEAQSQFTGGTVTMQIPSNWDDPQDGDGACSGNGCADATTSADTDLNVNIINTANADTIEVEIPNLAPGEKIFLDYNNAKSSSTGTDTFFVQSANSGETLKKVSSSPTVNVTTFAVILNEALPGPNSDWDGNGSADNGDEFIEIFNFTSTDTDLTDWGVDDAFGPGTNGNSSGDSITFPAGETIPANGWVVVWGDGSFVQYESDGDSAGTGNMSGSLPSLNDGGDTARVLASGGRLVDEVEWSSAQEEDDSSAARKIDNWDKFVKDSNGHFRAIPTPGLFHDPGGDTAGPANGRINFTMPDTTVSSRSFNGDVWVEFPNGVIDAFDTMTAFNNTVDLGVDGGSISPVIVNMTNGKSSVNFSMTSPDSALRTVSGTYAVTTTGTDSIEVFQPVIDTPAIKVGDGNDTHRLGQLRNKNRLSDTGNHTITIQVKHLEPANDTVSLYYNRRGQIPALSDTEISLNHVSGDTWSGTLSPTSDYTPGDSISFLLHTRIDGGETDKADSAGAGFQYRVDPRFDSSVIHVTDQSDTLFRNQLTGENSLLAGVDHTVRLRIQGADTAFLFDTATQNGAEPNGKVAKTSDTKIYGTNT
ncbi:MAG: lamin tail domain-containing protein, partial [bacterium]